ncbi:DNA topoisomerase 1 [Clydaea vesicula]|uniref:DNA topoisomerase I n=1 Tax=Clydaea vesicula TaxID=447962 RepID=A0AAD5U4B1_9FUNG|nr:DNA topoisomerase 1 [Clydaea vesicula]
MEKKKSTSKIENGLKSKEDVVGDADELGEGEEESEEYKWWLESVDDSVKWQTLEHSGPLFPPPYEPHGVKMKYDGVEVELKKDSEEVATFFAAILQTDYVKDKTFRENFFKDFKKILKKDKNNIIKEYEKCDFTPIYDYLQVEKEKKKLLTKEDKKKIKDEKASIDLKYGWCLLNGRKEKVGNYRIEPPGLFRGRGMHPLTGTLKLRVQPEQVTINIGEEAVIPTPPDGHKWGKVQHDPKVSWLATWKDNVNDNIKYIFLAANSSLKGQSDLKKFEKARELKKHIHRIRTSYTAELTDQVTAIRQRATAMYLIDKLALRAGNEKGEDEADTVGCCSLRYEHITLEPPNTVIFDFLGKDSIRYYNEVQVDAQVFKNLKIFKKEPKKEGDQLFDRLTTGQLNKHLSSQMAGLTGKVFRTFNASFTFQQELLKTPTNGTVQEKILAYNRANRQVAVLCNHQRSIPKGVFKLELKLVKELILKLLPKAKKSRPELLEEISDFEEEEVSRVKKEYKLFEMEKFRKKLEKKNEDKKNEKIKEETSFATKETKSEVRKSKKALSEDEVESGKKKKELDDWVILTEKEIENECKEFEKTAGYPSMKEKLEKMTLERYTS